MYKIGDKVRIVNLDERYYPPPCFKYLGKIMTIWSIVIEPNIHPGVYHMIEDGGVWYWGSNNMEKVEE